MRTFLLCAMLAGAARGADWPQWMGPTRNGVWAETGILSRFPPGGPKKLWSAPIAGGYAGPAVAGGKVYVHDFLTAGDVKDQSKPVRPANALKGKERLCCFDATTGKLLWKHEYAIEARISYPAGPRATPGVSEGRVYGLGMAGKLFCLDAGTGKLVWEKDLPREYGVEVPIWGFCSHPLIEGDNLFCIVGGKGSVCVAFDKKTGKQRWKALDADEPGYSSPVLIEAGGKKQLLVWHPEAVNGLDPQTGKVYWTAKLAPLYKMSIMAPQKSGDYLFTGGIGNRSLLLKLDRNKPAVEEVWRVLREGVRGKPMTYRSLGPVNMTPLVEGDTIYGVDQPGTLLAADLKTGKRLWTTFAATTGGTGASSVTAFLVKNADRHFLFNEKGELIIARLSRKEYKEIGRAKLIEPTATAFGRNVVWTHPAFADKCVFVRNDKELACYSLAASE